MGDERPVEMKIEARDGGTIQNVTQAVIRHLTLGIRRLPTDYATRIQNFLTLYLGRPGAPVPFGGREEALRRLDEWLEDGPPYLLLTAPAGRGKSALLVRWLERLRERDAPAVVFVPVSVRFRTNLETVVFAALAARLAHLFGEEIPGGANDPAEVWRGVVSSYLNRTPPDGRRLLVVLDGVDEAAGWEIGAALFPLAPPPGLKVLLSGRLTAARPDAAAYRRALGWESRTLAAEMTLSPLDRAGVADVLNRMGVPLDRLARDVDLVAELHRLSAGAPLLVNLYVQDLWARGEEAARLKAEDLRTIEPGYKGYFDRWWEDQRRLWGREYPLRERHVQTVFNVLACAFGPLRRADLRRLTGLSTYDLEAALEPIARFVIGDGERQEYAFSHPKLGAYFYERLGEDERREENDRFLAWGREVLGELTAGRRAPEAAPAYLVQYYTAHLRRAGAPVEAYRPLVEHEAWAAAWEAMEGSYAGYLGDVRRVWRLVIEADREAVGRGKPVPYLGLEVRCALIEATAHTLAGNIPPALMAALVKEGIWTPVQGLAYARQVPYPKQRAEALVALTPHLPKELLEEALATAREIEDDGARAEALAGLAPHLVGAKRALPLLRDALATAREIKDAGTRVRALASLAPHLAGAKHALPLLREALAAARGIKRERYCAEALASLAPHLVGAKRALPLLREALAAAREIENDRWRAEALAGLAPHLPEPLKGEALQDALAAAREIKDGWNRARALANLAPHLVGAKCALPLLREALTAGREIKNAKARAFALVALAPHLPEEEQEQALREALAAAQEIQDEDDRARALASLAPHLPEEERERVLREALAAAREIGDERYRSEALASLAPRLSAGLLEDALAMAGEIESEWARARALAALAPHLVGAKRALPLLREALAAAREIRNEDARAEALTGLAFQLAELGHPEEALTAAREIGDKYWQAEALARLAPHLTKPLKDAALREALAAARELPETWVFGNPRAEILDWLAPRLAELGCPEEALVAVKGIESEGYRARALAALAPHLPDPLKGEALRESLAAAREIKNKWVRAKTLTDLTPYLPEEEREQALREALEAARLEAAREVRNEWIRALVLAALAPYLPEGLLEKALAATREIRDADARAYALADLALHLVGAKRALPLLREALAAAREIGDERYRAEALADLAPHLPEPLKGEALQDALAAAREIEDAEYRARALAALASHLVGAKRALSLLRDALAAAREIRWADARAHALAWLAPYLPDELLREALAAARELPEQGLLGSSPRAEALAALASHLPEPLKGKALRKALVAAREIKNAKARAFALANLASHLPELLKGEALREALAAAREIEDAKIRARVLAALAPRLAELGYPKESLAVAREIEDAGARARALASLAPHLPEPPKGETLQEALAAAREIRDGWHRARALADLAPHLVEAKCALPLLREALTAGREIKNAKARAFALAALAPHLPEPLKGEALREALAAAREIRSADDRVRALAGLASYLAGWAGRDAPAAYAAWKETLHHLARRTRQALLSDLRALSPFLAALGGPEAVAETFRAIQDVGRWWP